MNTAIAMNAALSLDAAGVHWPFTPQRRSPASRAGASGANGVAEGRAADRPQDQAAVPGEVQAPSASVPSAGARATAGQPSGATGVTGVSPSTCAPSNRAGRVQPAVGAGIGGNHAATLLWVPSAARASSLSAPHVSFGQMISDVALVAVWAAIIPGFLWLGHAAGF